MSKYVSKQYLDNTSDESKTIDGYFVQDLRLSYDLKTKFANKINFGLLVNNIFNKLYAANGYTYSYIVGQEITERYLYPQAETNFLLSCKIRFE